MIRTFLTSLIAVYITMAERVLYPPYAIAPRVAGISRLEDHTEAAQVPVRPGAPAPTRAWAA